MPTARAGAFDDVEKAVAFVDELGGAAVVKADGLAAGKGVTVATDRASAVAAIEEDGAEVITFGCSGIFWLQPFVEKRLKELGWEVPVLEGYSCAISLGKLFVDLGVDASGLTFPSDRPGKWRRKKLV